MKKILLSILTIGLVASVAFGATQALFSDTETSTGNTFTAGTLNLQVGNDDPTTVHIVRSNIAPGWSKNWMWRLENTGSLDGKLSVEIKNVVNYDNGCNEPEDIVDGTCGDPGTSTSGELGQYLEQTSAMVYTGTGSSPKAFYSGLIGTLNAINGTGPHNNLTPFSFCTPAEADALEILASGEIQTFKLYLVLPEITDNIVQSDSVEFDIVFTLDQVL